MKCFNCGQYSPMGHIYLLNMPKNTYHICECCVAKALGEEPVGVGKPKRKERNLKNLRFYDKVMKRFSEYEPVIL